MENQNNIEQTNTGVSKSSYYNTKAKKIVDFFSGLIVMIIAIYAMYYFIPTTGIDLAGMLQIFIIFFAIILSVIIFLLYLGRKFIVFGIIFVHIVLYLFLFFYPIVGEIFQLNGFRS